MRSKVYEYLVVHTPTDPSQPEEIVQNGFVLATTPDQARAVVVAEELDVDDRANVRESEILLRPFV